MGVDADILWHAPILQHCSRFSYDKAAQSKAAPCLRAAGGDRRVVTNPPAPAHSLHGGYLSTTHFAATSEGKATLPTAEAMLSAHRIRLPGLHTLHSMRLPSTSPPVSAARYRPAARCRSWSP